MRYVSLSSSSISKMHKASSRYVRLLSWLLWTGANQLYRYYYIKKSRRRRNSTSRGRVFERPRGTCMQCTRFWSRYFIQLYHLSINCLCATYNSRQLLNCFQFHLKKKVCVTALVKAMVWCWVGACIHCIACLLWPPDYPPKPDYLH